jgi:hypothetical protein
MRKHVTQTRLRRELEEGRYALMVGYIDSNVVEVGGRVEVNGVVWTVDELWSSSYFSKDPKDHCHIAWTFKAKRVNK